MANDTLAMYHVSNFDITYNATVDGRGGKLIFTTSDASLPDPVIQVSNLHLPLENILTFFACSLFCLLE